MSERRGRPGGLLQPAVLITVDMVLLEAAFLVTYWLRFHAGIWKVPLGIPPLGLYLLTSAFILVVFFGIFYALGLYSDRARRSLEEELLALFRGVALGGLLVLASAFFLRGLSYSRSFFGLFFLSCILFLAIGRGGARLLMRRLQRRGLGARRVLLVGQSPMSERVVRAARGLPGLGLDPVGWLAAGTPGGLAAGAAATAAADSGRAGGGAPAGEAAGVAVAAPLTAAAVAHGLPCLGEFGDLPRVVRDHAVDLVVLTLPFKDLALVSTAAEELASLNVDVEFVPDLLELRVSRMRLTEIGGIPFFAVREAALSGADRIVKRTFDLVCAGLGALVLLPLTLVIAALVKLGSRGPLFYRQGRIGRDGREFQMVKFRTMRDDAEARSGPVWTVEGDPRVTAIGRWLRRFSLDELPQLWNVLRGEMSLVGPRPERQVFVEQFSRELPRYFERHRVRSGLTGWAQVNGLRGNTSIADRTLYDLYYVENWTLALDIKIILMTLHHVLRGENAY